MHFALFSTTRDEDPSADKEEEAMHPSDRAGGCGLREVEFAPRVSGVDDSRGTACGLTASVDGLEDAHGSIAEVTSMRRISGWIAVWSATVGEPVPADDGRSHDRRDIDA